MTHMNERCRWNVPMWINYAVLLFVLTVSYKRDYMISNDPDAFTYHIFYIPGETLPLSSGNKITLKFTTNGTDTAKGFHFVYQGKAVQMFDIPFQSLL